MDIRNRLPVERKRGYFSLRAKLILGFSLISAFASFITALGFYTNLQNQLLSGFKSRALSIIQVASLQQNGDEFLKISSAQDPLYEKFRLQNLKIRKSDPDIVYVFTARKDSQGLYFVVDAGEIGEENIAAFGERYPDATETLVKNFDTMTKAVVEPDIYTDQYGSFLSAYAPIFTTAGTRAGVIGIDILADTIVQRQKEIQLQSISIFFISLALGVLFGYLAGAALTRSVIKLNQGARLFSSGDFGQRVEINTQDEIGDLAQTFNDLAEEIQALISNLELRVKSRTDDLLTANQQTEKRASQLQIVAEVARAATSVQELGRLLNPLTNLISERFGYYHVGIFLLDEQSQYAVLEASNTEGGLKMLVRGHRLKVGEQGIVGYVTSRGEPRIALDVGQDAVFFDNPDLANTRSELALPLKIGEKIIGALDLQSTEQKAFSNEDVSVLSILADQVAIAIQNARSAEQAQRALLEADIAAKQLSGEAWQGYVKTIQTRGYRYDGVKSDALTEPSGFKDQKGALSIPVQLRGQTIGHIKLKTSDASRKWTDDERAIIESTAERAALAMEGARLLDEAQKRAARESFLSEIGTKLGTSFQLDSILRDTVEELGQNLKGSTVSFQLVNPSAPPTADVPKANGGSARSKKSE